ncbi:MAG: tRNA preQ1(34) S-adenosylmethionine ribosyltransferase-isomerase QueA [Phycisphaerae bacterium]
MSRPPMLMSDLDYHLPPERIATHPASPRDHSRLLVYEKSSNSLHHKHFYDLPTFLKPTDLLVVNDTHVLPAKLELTKPTGAKIPGLYLHELRPGLWQALLKTRGRAKPGDTLLATPYTFKLLNRLDDKGMWELQITPPDPAPTILHAIGQVPLPPYIEKQRAHTHDTDTANDKSHYQTIYAKDTGNSVAAPTAGLHFTPELLQTLDSQGIKRTTVDLEVGLGTFLPVETPTLEEHPMHTETFSIPPTTIQSLRAQRAKNARIVAVGTTAVRSLESASSDILAQTPPQEIRRPTDLKISPGYHFQLTDALITNFHLPRSTLMALVAAFLEPHGLQKLKHLYTLAIENQYRFYSYGDAMLLLP